VVNGSRPNVGPVIVRALRDEDLSEAERVFRLAFGTFLGVPEPEAFWSDRDYVYGRHRAAHVGELAGTNFITNWGSVGFFGPLTVRPDLQERDIGKALLNSTVSYSMPG
jgi:hypothetical protein